MLPRQDINSTTNIFSLKLSNKAIYFKCGKGSNLTNSPVPNCNNKLYFVTILNVMQAILAAFCHAFAILNLPLFKLNIASGVATV